MQTIKAIIFDLDGTLVDSYEAIAQSLNHACSRLGEKPLSTERVRLMVGRDVSQFYARQSHQPEAPVLQVQNLVTPAFSAHRR